MKKDKEFFNEVEEVLYSYEESYEEGAWEEFVLTRKNNKQRKLFYWLPAAAVVLILFSYGLFELTENQKVKDIPFTKNVKTHKKSEEFKQTIIADGNNNEVGLNERSIKQHFEKDVEPKKEFVFNQEKLTHKIDTAILQQKEMHSLIAQANDKDQQKLITTKDPIVEQSSPLVKTTELAQNKVVQKNTSSSIDRVGAGAYDSLVNRNTQVAKTSNTHRNFTYSAVVSPSLSNQKMNFGAGMELSYKLGNKLSINTGLLYAALNAKSGSKSFATTVDQGSEVNLAITGFEVPLGLQYQINNGFYVGAGVSGMNIISNKLEYNYQEDRVASIPNSPVGPSEQIVTIVSEQKKAKSTEELNNYIGFFTFSAGKKQAFGNSNLNIGPFVKIPFNGVSTERIKLLQAGFKLSFDF